MLHRYGLFEPSLDGHAFSTAGSQQGDFDLRHEINPHLSLRGLDGGVSFPGWNGVTLAEELEVVDERFHALLH